MDFSKRKSFKSHNSYKHHSRKISAGSSGGDSSHEELPILLDHHNYDQPPSADSSDRREVIVKVDGGDSGAAENKMWREPSFGSNNSKNVNWGQTSEDPPTKLIGQFLQKQNATEGDVALDMDLEMDELRRQDNWNFPTVGNRSKDIRVSFEPTNPVEITEETMIRDQYVDHSVSKEEKSRLQTAGMPKQNIHRRNGSGGSAVLKCSSNASFQRRPSMLRVKTRSRLQDPTPDELEIMSGRMGKSGQLKSGPLLGKTIEEEEDDLFVEEDLPEEYKRTKLSAMNLLQWASLVLIITALAGSLSVPYLRRKTVWSLRLWKWEVLILVLICGQLVSGWGIKAIVFCIERNFLLRKRVLYFVYGLRKAVQNCIWLSLVLMAWHFLFDEKVERNSHALRIVTKVLICLLITFLLWLLKTLMVKVLASSFHVSTYFDRIQDSLFNQYVIETLSSLPLIEDERMANEICKLQNAGATLPPDLRAAAFSSSKSGRVIGSGRLQRNSQEKSAMLSQAASNKEDEKITIDHLHRLNTKNVSAWSMKRLMNIIRHGILSTLDEQILESTHEDESTTKIRSEREAKAAARKIFQNVSKPGSKYIYLEDLMRFMRDEEANKTISLFEGASETRRISKSSLKSWVVNAFRERRALALTLNDTKTAVNKLHQMVNVIVGIIIVIIWLLILGIATSKFLLLVSSQLIVATFIFGNTCKMTFEAIIFLFVMHPFDVGDRCEIDGTQIIVEEMNILTTVFLRFDNLKIMYPNSVLATKPIANFYRSPDMGDIIEFCIHIATPAEKIALIKQKLISFMENERKEHWYPAPIIVVKDAEELNMLRLAIWPTHRMNFQNIVERYERRALLIEEMARIFREFDIQYRLLPLDINIRNMPPLTSTRVPPGWAETSS